MMKKIKHMIKVLMNFIIIYIDDFATTLIIK